MDLIFPNFTEEYKNYFISANQADVSVQIFNQNYSFPTTDKIYQLNQVNIIIGKYASRITIRKHKLTEVVNENINVKLTNCHFNLLI